MLKDTLNKGISTPIAIGIILILVILVGGFTWWQYGEMWRETSELPEIELPEKEKITDWQSCSTDNDCVCCDGSTVGDRICMNKNYSPELDCNILFFPKEFCSLNECKCVNNICTTKLKYETADWELYTFLSPQEGEQWKIGEENIIKLDPVFSEEYPPFCNLILLDENKELVGRIRCKIAINKSDSYKWDTKIVLDFCGAAGLGISPMKLIKPGTYKVAIMQDAPGLKVIAESEYFSIIEGDNYIESGSLTDDLNNDGKMDKIILSYNKENVSESYVSLYFLNDEGDYIEKDRIDSGWFILLEGEPRDINNDGIKEIFIAAPGGGFAARGFRKILTLNSKDKLEWIKFDGGDIKDDTLEEWGYRGICSYSRYIFDKDVNNNDKKEIIGFSAGPCGLNLDTVCGSNSLCDTEELKDKKPCKVCKFSVYEWDGFKFLYDEDLFELAKGKIEIEEFTPLCCDICVEWKE